MSARGQFSSRLGFIMAAAGAAVGLGNIWGFPSQVASNGGGAFVLVYLLLTLTLAYPILMAELTIGRYAQANMVDAMQKISDSQISKKIGKATGWWGLCTVSLILSFYSIVAGWMIAYFLQALSLIIGWHEFSNWLVTFSIERNIIFCTIFSLLTINIVRHGVSEGIEKWSSRLMPVLFILIVSMIVYISTLEGASEGWRVYLIPDFSKILQPKLLVSAMGQAFFSLSLGVGCMLIYGSYISKKENLVSLGLSVALVDSGIAILAGMLIIPAMYVALHNGVTIFDSQGALIDGDQLIFTVIPALFSSMGQVGNIISATFFLLMSIAALTSSISMLEVPVAYSLESNEGSRQKRTVVIGLMILLISIVLIFFFEVLFSFIVSFTTQYSQPLISLITCLFVGWVWHRNKILEELKQGNELLESTFFWRIWPYYVKLICPIIIMVMFIQTIRA
ncbi:MAG: NSS family neurotransmitter:Na+ symporter [Cognaticolwellia sp.]|jgi:NSS family neurotransmitter:Na+ symporter